MSDLPVPCANCGRPVRPSQAIWTRQDDDAEPCCCKECYQQHEDEGCPMEYGGYRDNPKLLAAHAAEVERLTAERDALDMALDQANADGEERRKEAVCWRSAFVKAGAERDAAVRERDAAVEALVSIENECISMGMPFMAEKVRAALAKIEGKQNATR